MWRRLTKFLPPAGIAGAIAYRYVDHDRTRQQFVDAWNYYKLKFNTPMYYGPKGMQPFSIKSETRITRLQQLAENKGIEPTDGGCVPLTIKYSLLTLKNQPFSNTTVNFEKITSKNAVYEQSQETAILEAAEKPNSEIKSEKFKRQKIESTIEPPIDDSDIAGTHRFNVSRARESSKQFEPFPDEAFITADIGATRRFIELRAEKFTDKEKNIYVNSVDVEKEVTSSLVDYIENYGLKRGQALNYNVLDLTTGGHMVSLVMNDQGKISFYDSNNPEPDVFEETDPKIIAGKIEDYLATRYPQFYLTPNCVKSIFPITNKPLVSSQIITSAERKKVSVELQRPDWDAETKPFQKGNFIPLLVERNAVMEITSLILKTGNGTVLKVDPKDVSKKIQEKIEVGVSIFLKPLSRPETISISMPLPSSNILKQAMGVLYARTLTKDEESKIEPLLGKKKGVVKKQIVEEETLFDVRHVERNEKGEIKVAIVELLTIYKQPAMHFYGNPDIAHLYRLGGHEIPEDMKSKVIEGARITFTPKPKILQIEKSEKKDQSRKR